MNIKTGLLFLLLIYAFWLPAQNTMIKTSNEELYSSAIELLDHEKYGPAREYFQRYVDLKNSDLRSIDAEYYIALCALNLYNADAENLFINFINKYPYHSKASLAYYDLATFYYNKKDFPKTIEYFEKADVAKLSANQKTERTFKLGYSYFNQKDFEKAEPNFNELKTGTNKYTYASNYYAGYIELKNGKYDEALVDLKKAEENDGYKPIVPAMIANVYYWQGNYDELISYSEKVLGGSEKSIQGKDEIYLLTADAYYKKNNYKKASEFFGKLVFESRSKVTPDIKYRYGYSLYKNRDMAGAIDQFKDLAGIQDSLQQASAYYLGHAYLQSGKKDFALPAFDLARKSTFNQEIREQALFNYGKINFELQRYHEAIPALKNFAKDYPGSKNNPEVQELLSESFMRTSNYAEAITYIESLKVRSLRINKAYQSVTFYYGVQLYNNEKFTEAIQLFEKSAEFPIDKDIFLASTYWKGECYSVLKDYPSSLNCYSTVFQKTDEDDEYFVKARYGAGYAYYNQKEYEKAFPHFKKYTEKMRYAKDKRNYEDAQLRLADLYFQKKDYKQAIENYNDAISGKVKDLDHAYYFRGVVYGIDDRVLDGIKSLDLVINNYPQSIYYDDAVFEKARLNAKNGNMELASQGFSQIINNMPTSSYLSDAYLKRAGAYADLNKDKEAIEDYKLILNNYPGTPVADEAFKGLQLVYSKNDQIEELREVEEKLAQTNPNNEDLITSRFNSANNLYFSQKYPQAIQAYNGFVNAYPNHQDIAEVRYNLADAYIRSGDTTNAENNYSTIIASHNSDYSVKAAQKLGDLNFKKEKYESAKENYKILAANAVNKKEKSNALVGLMISYNKLSNYDSSIYYANEIRNFGNASADAGSKALLYLGKGYLGKQDQTKAIDYFLSTINLAKDKNAAEAQYLIAEIQYNQKKYRQSLETLSQLNNTFSSYDEWIGKSFLLIVDNLEAMNEIFQAKATLKTMIEKSKDKQLVEKAKNRLAEIERKEKGNNE